MAATNVRRLLLPASVLLNLFLLALVCGHLLRAGGIVPASGILTSTLAAAESSLDAPDAAIFRRTLHEEARQYEAAASGLAAARQRLGAQVGAARFDPVATRAALFAWRSEWIRFTDAFSGPLVDALAGLSPEGRRRLVAERQREAIPLRVP